MKSPKLILLSSVCVFVLSANAQVSTPAVGWNLMGATENINVTDVPCANTIWVYDSSDTTNPWSLYKKDNTSTNNYGFALADSISKGEGFWALSLGCETVTSASGVLVDPYIEGATLYQDTDNDGSYDEGEPISTQTTASGEFTFSETLSAGKNILIKTHGLHEGVPFDLDLKGVVAADGSIDVVSPLTTFESKGLSATQIANILTQSANHAGVSTFVVSPTTILEDPLKGGLMDKSISDINDIDLLNIKASLASYGILKIMEGSTTLKALTSTELEMSGTTQGSPVNMIAQAMIKSINDSLSKAYLEQISTVIENVRTQLISSGLSESSANTAFPQPKVGLIVSVANKIINAIAEVGYTTCNVTEGSAEDKVSAALIAAQTKGNAILNQNIITKLGTKLYGLIYKDAINSLPLSYLNGVTAVSSDLASAINSTASTFVFDTNNDIVEY